MLYFLGGNIFYFLLDFFFVLFHYFYSNAYVLETTIVYKFYIF